MQDTIATNQVPAEEQASAIVSHNIFKHYCKRFPSTRFFYAASERDKQTILNTINSIAIMHHLVEGNNSDYETLTRLQEEDRLSYLSFLRLSVFMKDFKYHPEQRRQLELFMYLDGISRTGLGKRLTANLAADVRRYTDRDSLALAIVNYELLSEVRNPGFEDMARLRHAFTYRRDAINSKEPVKHSDGEAIHIVHAAVVCDIAGVVADEEELGASRTLTEGMARNLLKLIEKRHIPQVAKEISTLNVD